MTVSPLKLLQFRTSSAPTAQSQGIKQKLASRLGGLYRSNDPYAFERWGRFSGVAVGDNAQIRPAGHMYWKFYAEFASQPTTITPQPTNGSNYIFKKDGTTWLLAFTGAANNATPNTALDYRGSSDQFSAVVTGPQLWRSHRNKKSSATRQRRMSSKRKL